MRNFIFGNNVVSMRKSWSFVRHGCFAPFTQYFQELNTMQAKSCIEIDLTTWKRRQQFELFSTYENPSSIF
jgi:hypothetical protein